MQSAAQMAHGVCMAQNCANGSTIVMDGVSVVFANQYPNNASIDLLVQSTEGFTMNAAGNRMTKAGATTANCWVQYNQATIAGGVITPPTISYQAGVMSSTTEAAIATALRTQC
jgi:hypothetical protein